MNQNENSVVFSVFFEETAGVGQSFDIRLIVYNTMKCEDLQFNLSLSADDDLTADEQTVLDAHLLQCPLCRVRLAELRALRNDLRLMTPPTVPADLLYSVRTAVRSEVAAPRNNWLNLSNERYEWLQFRVMPYTVGTAVSLFLTVAFIISMNTTRKSTEKVLETARVQSKRDVVRTAPVEKDQIFVTNEELAALRTPVSSESPSLNTNGALVSLTKSFTDNKLRNSRNSDVTFVADVFGNGLAKITEVVSAPHNPQSLTELSNALQNDPDYAPFVPADLDRRSNVVRVVFRIQQVDVFEKAPTKKKSARK